MPEVNTTQILADVLGQNETTLKMNNRIHRLHTQSAHNLTAGDQQKSPRDSSAPHHASTHQEPKSHAPVDASTETANETNEKTVHHTQSKSAFSAANNHSTQDTIEENIQTSYVWDGIAERVFKDHKGEARSRMYRDVKSSSFNELALSPFIVASHIEEKNKIQRETKMLHYREGKQLPPEDFNYLANTSMLLNSYSDKMFIQTVVNNLEPEILDSVSNK